MKKIAKYIVAVAVAAGLSACSDYLDIADESSVSPENFPTNLEHCDLLLNSAYAGAHLHDLYPHTMLPFVMWMIDHSQDTYEVWDSRNDLSINNGLVDCGYLNGIYGASMKWIQYANTAIQGCESYAPNAASSEIDQLNYMKGQALFQRAFAYWTAQIFFELESKPDGLGLPIIREPATDVASMMPPRASVAETWNFVIETLEEASSLLKGHNSDKTRVTYWAARGLLAKALMQARRSNEAIPVLEDIINNSGARLLAFEDYRNAFYFDESHEFNIENLYEVDFKHNPKQEGPWGGFSSGGGFQLVIAPWATDLDVKMTAMPEPGEEFNTATNGGWGNHFVHDESVRRFGWNLPIAPARVANPDYNAKARRSIDNFPFVMEPAYKELSRRMRDDKLCDPRLFVSCAQPHYDTFKGPRNRLTWYDKSWEAKTITGIDKHYYFQPIKFTDRDHLENGSGNSWSSSANVPVIRLADIYLLYAEAIAASKPEVALEYVNKVHRRAYGCNPDQASQYDYSSLSDRTMAAVSDSQDILANDVIKYERWAEMFQEGQWWFDVRRYEILENECRHYKKTMMGTITYYERGYAQPIPRAEIEAYNGNLQQNYNY